jgi:hypothetical protein
MSLKPLKVIINLTAAFLMLFVLGSVRLYSRINSSIEEQKYEAVELVNALQEHLALIGLDMREAYAQGQEIELIGPPDGTFYERMEEVTLRWSPKQPLGSNELYVVAVAYYDQRDTSTHLEPVIRYFWTEEETVQLPSFDTDLNIPVLVWAVYIADRDTAEPTGPVSATYRLLYATCMLPGSRGYQEDNGL